MSYLKYIFLIFILTAFSSSSIDDKELIFKDKLINLFSNGDCIDRVYVEQKDISLLKSDILKNMLSEDLIKEGISQLPSKIELIKKNHKRIPEITRENIYLEKVYSIEQEEIYVGKIETQRPSNKEIITFKAISINQTLYLMDVHGNLVDDEFVVPKGM